MYIFRRKANRPVRLFSLAAIILSVILCLLLPQSILATAGTFATKVDYPAGTNPLVVTTADFNGDAFPDLAVANYNGDTVSVLLNKGDGTFNINVDYSLTHPHSVAAADVNGDFYPDLIVANSNIDKVSVLLNNGTGAFTYNANYSTGTTPTSVAAADFNGDSYPDLALANYNGVSVSVLLNNGDGTFAGKVDYDTGDWARSVAAANLNGDLYPDLVVANANSNTVSVFINNGNGTFASKVDYSTGNHPWWVAAADFNGDSRSDLVSANFYDNTVSVLLNNGNGTFAPKQDYTTGNSPGSVACADFNNDAYPDLVVVNCDDNNVSVMFNNGDGTFAAKTEYITGLSPTCVAAADVNRDTCSDLVVSNWGANSVSVLLNISKPPEPVLLWKQSVNDDITDIAVGDLDGDLKADVAAIDTLPFNATLHIWHGEGDGLGGPLLYWSKPIDGYSVALGDIDDDKINEVVAHRSGSGITAYKNNGDEIWLFNTLGEVKDIEIGDIDGNGKKDVVACNNLSAPGTIYAIDGVTGSILPGWPKIHNGEEFLDVAVGQLDGTGGDDVAAIGRGKSGSLFAYSSTGALLWSKTVEGRTVEIGDVNGDSLNEVVAGTFDGYVRVYAGTSGALLYTFAFNSGEKVSDVELGELDGVLANGLEVACISNYGPSTLYALDIDNPTNQIMWKYEIAWNSPYYGESIAIGDVDRDYQNEVIACSRIDFHRVYAFDAIDHNKDGFGDLVWEPYEVDTVITDLETGDLDGDGDQDVVFGTLASAGPGSIFAIKAVESQVVSATNTGMVYFDSDPSTLTNLRNIAEESLLQANKPNYIYPHGFFSFDIKGLIPGQEAIVTVTLPYEAPVGTKWVKYVNGSWSTMDIGSNDGDKVITFKVTDGGAGDADGIKNGVIVEPGGPGYPWQPVGVGGEVIPVNRLGVAAPWLIAVITFLAVIAFVVTMQRKRS
jgi:hypothetical protein